MSNIGLLEFLSSVIMEENAQVICREKAKSEVKQKNEVAKSQKFEQSISMST